MTRRKKIIVGTIALVVIFVVLYLSGVFTVHLTQRFVYAGCTTGCNTDLNDVTDCTGFLAYLKENQPKFVSSANTIGINLDKPDKIAKVVSSDGKITCRYYAN